jgi:hypothetical protein
MDGKSLSEGKWMNTENRILVVDDEKEIRGLLYQALIRFGGFFVELAESGEEALQKIEQESFDLMASIQESWVIHSVHPAGQASRPDLRNDHRPLVQEVESPTD